jgi:branched-chain amino acid transport system ATP-binding protein
VLLKVTNLSKKFGGLEALKRINLYLTRGEIVGVLGPNGAGKTTLFNVICGFYPPDEGEVVFDNKCITGKKPWEIAHLGIGRTFQLVKALGSMTVLENVMVGTLLRGNLRQARNDALTCLEIVGLVDRAHFLANSLNIVDRKRLELARALGTKPDLLLLDECMAGLNPSEIHSTLGIIRDINHRGTSILLIEHIIWAVANIAHRVVILDYGEKIADGTVKDVFEDPRVVAAYIGEGTNTCWKSRTLS